jgi:hypothetical protein
MPQKLFDTQGVNFTYQQYSNQKALAMKALFRQWGLILRRALKEESNLSTRSDLYKAIQFRVEPQSRRDINGQIRLLVGILDPHSPVLKYLKFVLYGTRRHFVPIQYKGRSTGIFEWAKSNHVIKRKGNRWVWASGNLAGKKFYGVPNVENRPNDFFTRVYFMYDDQIRRDIQKLLEGE